MLTLAILLHVDEVCGNVSSLSSPTGVVSTLRVPYRYPKRVNCQYTIDSGQINSVIISVDRLNFQYAYYTDSSCNFGWLTVSTQNRISFDIMAKNRQRRCN